MHIHMQARSIQGHSSCVVPHVLASVSLPRQTGLSEHHGISAHACMPPNNMIKIPLLIIIHVSAWASLRLLLRSASSCCWCLLLKQRWLCCGRTKLRWCNYVIWWGCRSLSGASSCCWCLLAWASSSAVADASWPPKGPHTPPHHTSPAALANCDINSWSLSWCRK